jgi:hypothetical protein
MKYPEIELAENPDGSENQTGDDLEQMRTGIQLYQYQQLFWRAFAKGRNPEDWTIKVSGFGVDLDCKDGSMAIMGHRASTELILHGAMLLLDDIFKLLGGDGIPRDVDETGDALPLDIEKVKSEIRRLVECNEE